MMFIYIKCRENEQFLVNTNCSIIVLLQYLRAKLGLAESELVDICDERGALKLLFVPQHSQERASRLLPPHGAFIVCTINRTSAGAYLSITPHVTSPDSALQEVLQSQVDSLEKTRLRHLRALEDRKTSGDVPTQSHPSQPVKGRTVHTDAADEESHRQTGSKRNRN